MINEYRKIARLKIILFLKNKSNKKFIKNFSKNF